MHVDLEASAASEGTDGESQPFTQAERDIIIKDMYVDVPENL